MRQALKIALAVTLLVGLTGTAWSQTDTRATSAAAAGTPPAIVGALGGSWDIPPYDCATALGASATLAVTKVAGDCEGQTYESTFTGSSATANGITYLISCNPSTQELTSSLGFCQTGCYCSGSDWDVACPSDPPTDLTACHNATCAFAGTCGAVIANQCGASGFNCETDADCDRCTDTGLLCASNEDCNLGNCGPRPGICSGADVACLPNGTASANQCAGSCDPAQCGNRVSGFCDDDLDRACSSAADCGSCQNAPFEPCEQDTDCNFGSCNSNLTAIDAGFSFANGINVATSLWFPPSPEPFPMLDRTRTGLLIGGLLLIGIVLILRRVISP